MRVYRSKDLMFKPRQKMNESIILIINSPVRVVKPENIVYIIGKCEEELADFGRLFVSGVLVISVTHCIQTSDDKQRLIIS